MSCCFDETPNVCFKWRRRDFHSFSIPFATVWMNRGPQMTLYGTSSRHITFFFQRACRDNHLLCQLSPSWHHFELVPALCGSLGIGRGGAAPAAAVDARRVHLCCSAPQLLATANNAASVTAVEVRLHSGHEAREATPPARRRGISRAQAPPAELAMGVPDHLQPPFRHGHGTGMHQTPRAWRRELWRGAIGRI